MEAYIREVRKDGDTVGGIVSCVIQGVPVGLGEPVFDRLHAELGKAMLSINAVKGFEYGGGFASTRKRGSQNNDIFLPDGTTCTNYSWGHTRGDFQWNGYLFPCSLQASSNPYAGARDDQ